MSAHLRKSLSSPWIPAAIAFAAVGFGTWGFLTSESGGERHSYGSALYHAVQLLVLNGAAVDSPAPWPLHVGRALGIVAFGWTLALFLLRRFEQQLRRGWYACWGGHTIVLGASDHAGRVALALHEAAERVVVIALEEEQAEAEELLSRGLTVYQREARAKGERHLGADHQQVLSDALRRLGAQRANKLIAASRSDGENLAFGRAWTALREELSQSTSLFGRRNPVCLIHLADEALRVQVTEQALLADSVKVYDQSTDHQRARRTLREFPLDFLALGSTPPTDVGAATIVLVGYTPFLEEVALHAGRTAHYVHRKRTRVLWIAGGDRTSIDELQGRHPGLWDALEFLDTDSRRAPEDWETLERLVALVDEAERSRGTVQVFVAAPASPSARLGLGMRFAKIAKKSAHVRVLVDVEEDAALWAQMTTAEFLAHNPGLYPIRTSLREDESHIFASTTDSADEDALAKSVHLIYEKMPDPDKDLDGRPARTVWEKLTESHRLASRASADHLWIKARAVGCHVAPLALGGAPVELTPEETELLSQLEHERWIHERAIDGWRHGVVRDNDRKRHPDMVPWRNLPNRERKIDHLLVQHASTALARIKPALGLFRGPDPSLAPHTTFRVRATPPDPRANDEASSAAGPAYL